MTIGQNELRMAVLKFYQDYAKTNGSQATTSCTHLAGELGVAGNELGVAVDYLKNRRLLNGNYLYGQKPAEGMFRITSNGIDVLINPKQDMHNSNSIIFTEKSPRISTETDPSREITNAFKKLRELHLTPEEQGIVNEIERIVKSDRPSIDKILEKGKGLCKKYGETATRELTNIIGTIIRLSVR
jgi:hypothetical protein